MRRPLGSLTSSDLTRAQILLVPTTSVLLASRDRESGQLYSDLASSDDFLGSHVLRITPDVIRPGAGGKVDALNMRESRGKAKQYTTLNGRTVIIKDNFVYSNKGFRSLNSAQILKDALWYPDSLEPRSWLIYYISRPLVGSLEDTRVSPAILPVPGRKNDFQAPGDGLVHPDHQGLPRKKDIKTFNDLLNNFPLIAKQMQPGLEKLFKEFSDVFEKPLPPPPSANSIPDPLRDGPITAAVKRARSNSFTSSSASEGGDVEDGGDDFYAEDDEDIMRGALETAVTTAIDIFQMVDKSQLSLLGATTDLTGPVVERLIERYVAEQVHDQILYPKLCALKRPEDLDLECKVHHMEFVDISQVGIGIQGGQRGKHELTLRLGRAVEEFRKIGVAGSPQQMMEILLMTLKTVTQLSDVPSSDDGVPEKISPVLTINADTLVSLLLVVVIRAQVRHLQARLLYMRHFIFIDDVESGEMGYALSTFEAVLSYLARDSGGLRKASRRNKKLWVSTCQGNIHEMMKIMEPEKADSTDDSDSHDAEEVTESWGRVNGNARTSSSRASSSRRTSQASTLNHVFFFEAKNDAKEDAWAPTTKRPKMVTLDMRSMSSSSEMSFLSRATTIDSMTSGIEGDTSIERLSQTEDSAGESVLMMAIQHERTEALRYLLSLEEFYPINSVLDDVNNDGTTLFSAAVQLGNMDIVEVLLEYILKGQESLITSYMAVQDVRGRSAAHYLFTTPQLITRLGKLLPWRQKDKNGQTPLFALCRSYDHHNYKSMVDAAIRAARLAQGDGQPLHLDDHIDLKGNTLLHIANDPELAYFIMTDCDSDVNATNDKKFTALMVASKYGRLGMVRALFSDPRVDVHAKELRGLTAVELAKDDEIRNRIDDMILFAGRPADDGRITAVVRSFFVEDATIRLVVKSAAPSTSSSFTVTTCRRSLTDFENLAKLLGIENPASWLPSISGLRSPFQIPSKPSREVLKDIQVKLDHFLKLLLGHSTFSTHEMLWEFFLVPEIQADLMAERSKLKAETRVERIMDEYDAVEDVGDVEQFVDHARDMVRSVNYATKSLIRRTNGVKRAGTDMFDAGQLFCQHFAALPFLPPTHTSALEKYFSALSSPSTPPTQILHSHLLSLHSSLIALLMALSRPTTLISSIQVSNKDLRKTHEALARSGMGGGGAFSMFGLLDDTRQRMDKEKEEKLRKMEMEKEGLGRELRYSYQTVAGELAGWQEWRGREVRRGIREFVRGMVVLERERGEGLRRALRGVKTLIQQPPPDLPREGAAMEESEDEEDNGELSEDENGEDDHEDIPAAEEPRPRMGDPESGIEGPAEHADDTTLPFTEIRNTAPTSEHDSASATSVVFIEDTSVASQPGSKPEESLMPEDQPLDEAALHDTG